LAPDEYCTFLSEVARSSPACGLAQICGNQDVVSALRAVVEGSIDVQSSQNYKELQVLQHYVPVLATFIIVCPKDTQGQLPDDVRCMIGYILECAAAPFTSSIPPPTSYPTNNLENNVFSFFPHCLKDMGQGTTVQTSSIL